MVSGTDANALFVPERIDPVVLDKTLTVTGDAQGMEGVVCEQMVVVIVSETVMVSETMMVMMLAIALVMAGDGAYDDNDKVVSCNDGNELTCCP